MEASVEVFRCSWIYEFTYNGTFGNDLASLLNDDRRKLHTPEVYEYLSSIWSARSWSNKQDIGKIISRTCSGVIKLIDHHSVKPGQVVN